jgi:hypothetical protein
MEFDLLNDDNYEIYGATHYDNPGCTTTAEFYEDLNRTKYLKRLFYRYTISGELKERLILNHLIIFYNVFGIEAATRLLFFKIEEDYWRILKPFLVYLNVLPDRIKNIDVANIDMDEYAVSILRNL